MALYARLQRMSLRFFTHTRVGELMSRLNNDVVGAQNAISNTIVGIITNIIQAIAILAVMLSLEWHLTILCDPDPAALHPGGARPGQPPARYRARPDGCQRPDERR